MQNRQHEEIIPILTALTPRPSAIPGHRPGDRFNVLLKLERTIPTAQWALQQTVPMMLSGDKSAPT
jgi:hypothetical protein